MVSLSSEGLIQAPGQLQVRKWCWRYQLPEPLTPCTGPLEPSNYHKAKVSSEMGSNTCAAYLYSDYSHKSEWHPENYVQLYRMSEISGTFKDTLGPARPSPVGSQTLLLLISCLAVHSSPSDNPQVSADHRSHDGTSSQLKTNTSHSNKPVRDNKIRSLKFSVSLSYHSEK